ncbi:MAG TPA: IS110 family transposase [Vicinamibacterales bacterium]|nr:IS110 family transposase [Vicinamibacterales bacterium]
MTSQIERCAGLDVHKATLMATARIPDGAGGRQAITANFGTTTSELLALRDWLQAHRVTHVAMESTGVYWKPVYYMLEDDFTLLLVNAQHLKHVPGRKSDVQDSAWIAQLLECGLLRSSFVPPAPIRDLRELTRCRKKQTYERAREVNRLHRVLEDAGIKLASVATDVMGASGRAMLEALLRGTTDASVLADLARGRLRRKLPALRTALQGRFRAHHAFLVGQILAKIDFLEEAIEALTREIETRMAPFEPALSRLETIPGVQRRTAEAILSEISPKPEASFPTAGHLCSWAAVCPGQEESAGKRRSGRTRAGNNALRTVLIEAALAASRARGTALQARYFRIRRHRGHKKAIVAVAHQILEIAYYLLSRDTTYQELGADYFDRRYRERAIRRHVRELQRLGLQVTLEQAA